MIEPVTINLRFLAKDLGLPVEQVQSVVTLLDDGFPVPFIARYRKDQTDNLDEENLRLIEAELKAARTLCERKQTVLKTIDSQGKLTPELDKKIREAKSSRRLEDLYLPFKPKKQTLAATARQRGLEPLALEIFEGKLHPENLDQRASEFIDEDKKILSVADALLGSGHIIAEMFAEKIEVLQRVREIVHGNGKIVTEKIVIQAEPDSGTGKAVGNIEKKSKKIKEKRENPKKDKENTENTTEKAEEATVAESVKNNVENTNTENTVSETETSTETVVEPMTSVEITAETSVETEVKSEDGPQERSPNDITEPVAADSSGSGGGDVGEDVSNENNESLANQVVDSKEVVVLSDAEPKVVESVVEAVVEGVAEMVAVTELKTAETVEATVSTNDVEAVTEQFQQWKEAQQEQGIPTVKSQNRIKKQKKEEARKKKEEIKNRQQEHFQRQFSDYFNYSSGVRNLPAHRILAINRGERSKVLRVKIDNDHDHLFGIAKDVSVPSDHLHLGFLEGCLKDALQRLVVPAMERELRAEMTEYAEAQGIKVFAKNLRNLLLQPPLNRKRVLALDPGMRHGCKIVALDEFGNVLNFETVYLVGNAERKAKAMEKIAEMVTKYKIDVIAIGNGTGCRETEEAVSNMIASQFADSQLAYIVINEAGASVYSASPIAREEFPNYDVLLRGAVSIGRRLQDPLNELVKIDPASLGVGMYQHDLKGKQLREVLTEVVESCVNFVGVDLNTATPAILRYVSGLNQLTAKRIYEYRKEHGPFRCREDLKKVSGFGDAAFTHAAGFLKIYNGSNPLDATWIHPESYPLAEKILEKLGFSVEDLRSPEKIKEVAAKIAEGRIGELASKFSSELGAGLFTVRDILDDLSKPGRDPRESLPPPIFKKGVLHMEDLSPGMELTGTVLNVVDFGAFVDIGLHDSGLVHISQMADRYIRDAHDKVCVGDIVRVWVVEADPKRKRISLTMLPPGTEKQPRHEPRRERHEQRDGEKQERPKREGGERQDRPSGNRPVGDRPPRKDGGGQGRDGRRDDRGRRDRDGGDRRNRDRDRTPRTYVAAPKESSIKPITDDMKKGKEPLRSFGDLAQLLGHVQVPDKEEEKRRKKEEERKRREKERQATEAQTTDEKPATDGD